MLGRARFEWHRERTERRRPDPLKSVPQPASVRGLVAGFLVIEGLVALGVGLVLTLAYWPAVENGAMANPVSFCGLGIVGASLIYMIFLGLGMRLYSLLYPLSELRPHPEETRLRAPESADDQNPQARD